MISIKVDHKIKKPKKPKFWTFEIFYVFFKPKNLGFFRSHFPALCNTAVVDNEQINCSVHTETSAWRRRKFKTKAIRAAKCSAALRSGSTTPDHSTQETHRTATFIFGSTAGNVQYRGEAHLPACDISLP